MIFRVGMAITAGLTLLLAIDASAHAPPQYRSTDLGALAADTNSVDQDLNEFGAVAGLSTLDGYTGQAFLYEHGHMTNLGTLGGPEASAYALNNLGHVVGGADIDDADEDTHAFVYAHGSMQDLGTLGGVYSQAFDINDLDVAAGESDPVGDEVTHGVIWRRGTLEDIGTLGGPTSSAFSINFLGEVTGISDLDAINDAGYQVAHAIVYYRGHLHDIGTLGGTYGLGYRINQLGQIVGSSTTANDVEEHAFIYRDGRMQDIGTLGGIESRGYGINNFGQATGRSTLVPGVSRTDPYNYHAYLYTDGAMYDLNDLIADDDPAKSHVSLFTSYAINDLGWISATGVDDRTGRNHAYLLKPDVRGLSFFAKPQRAADVAFLKIQPAAAAETSASCTDTNPSTVPGMRIKSPHALKHRRCRD